MTEANFSLDFERRALPLFGCWARRTTQQTAFGRALCTREHCSKYPSELVGTSGAAAVTVHAGEDIDYTLRFHPFQQSADRLQVSIAPAHILDIVQFAVNNVKINLLRANQRTRHRSNVPHPVHNGVAYY